VSLIDHGLTDGTFYFAMEYCAGGSVADLQRRTPGGLPLNLAVGITLEALDGLAFAHERGFVHRDLKPENLLLENAAGGGAKVTDFGLAKSFQQAGLGSDRHGSGGGPLLHAARQLRTSASRSQVATSEHGRHAVPCSPRATRVTSARRGPRPSSCAARRAVRPRGSAAA
jgi:serine/threonine protein kinase